MGLACNRLNISYHSSKGMDIGINVAMKYEQFRQMVEFTIV